jgi:preprotein translocase subunit SecA
MRLFGGDRMTKVFAALGVDEDVEIQHKMLSNAIETAQKRVEGRNFSIRKHVLEYDDVMNKQREIIYAQRHKVLEGDDLHENFRKMIEDVMRETLLDFCAGLPNSAEWDTVAIDAKVKDLFGDLAGLSELSKARQGIDAEELNNLLTSQALEKFESRAAEIGSEELMREAERVILLRTVDSHWMDHIDAMDDLRDSIGMRGYAQHDPVIEYKKEGFAMFEAMNAAIREDAVRLIMRARFNTEQAMQRKSIARNITEGHGGSGYTGSDAPSMPRSNARAQASATNAGEASKKPVQRDAAKVGRNDPCPCGSGKKYKNCCGKNAD